MISKRKNGSRQNALFLLVISAIMIVVIFYFLDSKGSPQPAPSDNGSTFSEKGSSFKQHRSVDTTNMDVVHSLILSRNRKQNSKFAYVTLLSGIDSSFKYRGFLYNLLIMKRALLQAGSVADFIALIGFSEPDLAPFEKDMQLLQDAGIIIYILPRLLEASHKLGFAEMALLKITPWSFIQYEKMQFFDGDVMPLQNMDCFFELNKNAFTVGAVSPLNSGWYLALPNLSAYNYMKEKSIWRLSRDWDSIMGWGEKMPEGLMYRGGKKACEKWEFNGADMDQGLLLHYFIVNNGNALLVDTETKLARSFEIGLLKGREKGGKGDKVLTARKAFVSCSGIVPTDAFAHFTGRSKPWMLDQESFTNARNGGSLSIWKAHLDSLHLQVNTSNVIELKLGSPLGFFNAGFPKGGFKKKE